MKKSKYVVYNKVSGCYWVNKKQITIDLLKSTKYSSLSEVIKNVPLMRDWNVNYDIYEYTEGESKKIIDYSEWNEIYYYFTQDEPNLYKELYKENAFESTSVELI